MGFRDLQSEFNKLTPADFYDIPALDLAPDERLKRQVSAEQNYRYWMVKLLFEIHGDLDSLVVAYRELVRMQKEKRGE